MSSSTRAERSQTAFAVFPNAPVELGAVFEQATKISQSVAGRRLTTWAQSEIAGRFIVDGILEKIDSTDFVIADVTKLNFNVFFEIGYSIGRGKRILLVINSSLTPETKELQRLGLLDTVGWSEYTNASQLATILAKATNADPIKFPTYQIDRNSPIYVVDALHKTDAALRTVSRVKKARVGFRSFDPAEQPRLSTSEAYKGVAKSVAVVAHLLSSWSTNFRDNNLRVAFVAGLSYGLDRDCLLFQDGSDEPVPMDYRDLVTIIKHPTDVDRPIAELVPKITEKVLGEALIAPSKIGGFLASLDLGASAAENEVGVLGHYYVPTDHYNQALNGSIRLVVGRKGSGKTALFFQVRDRVRSDRKMVVLDLKPEGHQLKKFKEAILLHVSDATQDHVVAAFWEYLLLLEICNKLLEKDRQAHIRDHTIYSNYRRLSELYVDDIYVSEGDFSERMNRLVSRLAEDFETNTGGDQIRAMNSGEVTSLIYKHDIQVLRKEVSDYYYCVISHSRPQHGQQGSVRASARAMSARMVVIEAGLWRSGRTGTSPRAETSG